MGKALAIGEAFVILKELWDSGSEVFNENIPNNFFKVMDEMAFLTSKFLGFNSSGELFDKSAKVLEAVSGLTNFFIWGLLLFYGFRSLFSYFLSKKLEVPWKMFIRVIIFGILANCSAFICYTGVFLTENCTEYIRGYIGEDIVSFEIFEEYIKDTEVTQNIEEESDIYTLDSLISIFTYFSTFFVAVCLGGRYILIKILILLSPIFFIFGGFRYSEKIFFKWGKSFLILLFMQIIFCVVLAVVGMASGNDLMLKILVCSVLLILYRNILKFLILSY